MFGRILYVSDNTAYIENKVSVNTDVDLLNVHLIFEHNNQKILGEIVEVNSDKIKVHFLGEYVNGEYYNGLLRKASLNSTIRVINAEELTLLLGTPSKDSFVLGKSATYKNYLICPKINSLFANHMCIFGNSGSGKSCGVARVIQNILGNEHSLAYNANFVFFDSFGEYKNAFKSINNINNYYNYKFITSKKKDESDFLIHIPINLLTVDDFAILLQADKHSQLTILNRAIKYARLFAQDDLEATRYKNSIIAKALITILYSSDTSKQKKDDIFSIIDICHTKEFNFNTEIKGVGYTRSFSECFSIDSKGRFGEEVLITNYILSYADQKVSYEEKSENCSFSLNDFAKALDFTLISEGFNKNKLMHDDAQLLKVRLNTILNNEMNNYFSGEYTPVENFITSLASVSGKKAHIINKI